MSDVAFDSERHTQARHDVHDSGQELAASALSANVLAMAQMFGHWTTENAAQDMGKAVRSFLTAFSSQMAHEAQFVGDMDVKVNQAVADFEGTEEDARAAMAAVSTALLSLNQGESAHQVYSQETIDKLTSENKPKDEAVQGVEHESEQEASNTVGQTPSHDKPNSY
jgi:hypothetical protein